MESDLLGNARRLAQAAGGTHLPAEDVASLLRATQLRIDELMLALIPLAAERSQAPISQFHVGAIGEGATGALYFGANVEISGGPLGDCVHAEQAVVINAVVHNERGLKRLAVSAPPCGHCRQFLWELRSAHDLQILVVDHPSATLAELLPRPFGPTDLGQTEPLMAHSSCNFLPDTPPVGPAAEAAIAAASASYAPYSQSPAGVGLATRDGVVFRGPYIENAAFNPSLPPMIAAHAMIVLSGRNGAEVSQAALVRLEGTMIDHDATARRILDKIAPGVPLQIISARIVGT